ncbi:hypothetical protein LXA43DRAFT_1128572 [Ganoderma leucocontextum]|nr:hypothetical protein LXA43DRAFT_1128572 [Ganoderma leucocontextum]
MLSDADVDRVLHGIVLRIVQVVQPYLLHLAVEHYPSDNCAVVFPNPDNPPHDPLQMLLQYLMHNSGIEFAKPYLNTTALAQQWGKPFLLFETNTASCGANFSGAHFHFGGAGCLVQPVDGRADERVRAALVDHGPVALLSHVRREVMGKSNTTRIWAGQTLGGCFASDGRWKGEEIIQTVQCDQNTNSCIVKVPAPGAAISAIASEQYSTYSTAVITKSKNTVTIDPSVMSNGEGGKNRLIGGTSPEGGSNAAAAGIVGPGLAALVSVLCGLAVFWRIRRILMLPEIASWI